MLDDNKCMEHFGVPWLAPPHLIPRVLSVRSILAEKIGSCDIGGLIRAGYAKSLNNQTLFNIAKIRDVVDETKAQVAQAEAEGFRAAEPTEYGAENHSEAHRLMERALGLWRVVDGLKPLVDCGVLRIVCGMRLYHVDGMRVLMERGRAAEKPPEQATTQSIPRQRSSERSE
jgi:hypothetical protein